MRVECCEFEIEQIVRQHGRVGAVAGDDAGWFVLFRPEPDLVVEAAPPTMEVVGERGVPERGARPGHVHGLRRPAADRPVIGMPGHAVGTEGDDEIRSEDGDEAGDGIGGVVLFAAAVRQPQHVELLDADGGEAPA